MPQTDLDSTTGTVAEVLTAFGSMSGVSSLICCAAYGVFSLYFAQRLLRGRLPVTAVALVFLAALAASSIWAGVAVVDMQRHWSDRLPVWLVPTLDLLRYGLWFSFLLMLMPSGHRGAGLRWARPFAAAAVLLQMALIVAAESRPPGEFARPQALAALVLAVLGLVLVEQMLRNASADARWNAKPVALGLGAIFVFDLFIGSQAALFQRFDGDAVSVRALVHAAAVPLLYVASRRHGDWLGKLHVSRSAVFHSAALLLVGGYLLMVAAVGYYVRYTGGHWARALSVALVFVALVGLALLVASGAMRARLRVYISKNFFSYRYDYREEWLRFTQLLASSVEPQYTGETVVRALANLVESPSGMLWMQRSTDSDFLQVARWNLPQQAGVEARQGALGRFWQERAWIIDVDEWRANREAYPGLELPGWLVDEPRCWLVVPLLVRESLIGFAVLGRPRAEVELNWEVRDLLRTAASQASGYLAQAQATEALLEARKFDAFNRMSAFVVHDLKNIVTQLSLMMKNAKRLRDNPEFQQDMLDTVENSLEKMRQLMLQLREGDKPHGVTSGVDLEQIAKRLAAAASSKGRVLELDLQPGVSTRGHPERVERVLGHVVQNAFDATPLTGRVCLTLDSEGSQARVRVDDNGCGMSEEFIQNRLFKPFQTTKASGMGIGAHESHQYVQELGGKISVQSELNQGTTVTLLLPLFHAQAEAPLAALEVR
ncbi:XrtA/PEP-CTERM system histidine kinase PrsK [Roseateles asaccharophilus]|uniref:histidine kinase n=1 Tax=Roseateles asaccharophilus TaxID=582607 RepID=A0ABU2AC80_9BURK|nr:XrtA/PEP-CTERM system histidine kinase PrsK [Roseateles asaccharophilus]MDR7334198.1 putative PEP-CTERM system histidine kinase [Roseateles asaccharophilus]